MQNGAAREATLTVRGPVSRPAAALAVVATLAALILLAALHGLSPEFNPSWRMISEYALGHYGWVLSAFFLCWAAGTWALAFAIAPAIRTPAGKAGMVLLVLAGCGEALAAFFDVNHMGGHAIAGILGVFGFPAAALLLTSSLRRTEPWRANARALRCLAHLSWISVALLAASLALMTVQLRAANGGHLPRHAPKSLPAGVLGIAGWADRLIVAANCAWVLLVGWRAIQPRRPA